MHRFLYKVIACQTERHPFSFNDLDQIPPSSSSSLKHFIKTLLTDLKSHPNNKITDEVEARKAVTVFLTTTLQSLEQNTSLEEKSTDMYTRIQKFLVANLLKNQDDTDPYTLQTDLQQTDRGLNANAWTDFVKELKGFLQDIQKKLAEESEKPPTKTPRFSKESEKNPAQTLSITLKKIEKTESDFNIIKSVISSKLIELKLWSAALKNFPKEYKPDKEKIVSTLTTAILKLALEKNKTLQHIWSISGKFDPKGPCLTMTASVILEDSQNEYYPVIYTLNIVTDTNGEKTKNETIFHSEDSLEKKGKVTETNSTTTLVEEGTFKKNGKLIEGKVTLEESNGDVTILSGSFQNGDLWNGTAITIDKNGNTLTKEFKNFIGTVIEKKKKKDCLIF